MASIYIPKKEFSYSTSGFRFNGVNDRLQYPGTPNVVDGKRWSGSFWFRRLGNFGVQQNILQATSDRLLISFRTTDRLRVVGRNASGTIILEIETDTVIVDENLHHFLFSVDMENPAKKHIYLDGKNDLQLGGTFTDDFIEFTRSTLNLFGLTGVFYTGEIADFWIDYDTYIDFSIKGNRDKFAISNKQPVFLGEHGEKPLNKVPTLYFSGSRGDKVNRNRGSISLVKQTILHFLVIQ